MVLDRTYDLEGVGDNADSHNLLTAVTAVHHERVGETLNDGALSLAETLGGIATGSVGGVDRGADLDVVAVDGQTSQFLFLISFDLLCAECCVCWTAVKKNSLFDLLAQENHVPQSNSPYSRSIEMIDWTEKGCTHVREISRTSTLQWMLVIFNVEFRSRG